MPARRAQNTSPAAQTVQADTNTNDTASTPPTAVATVQKAVFNDSGAEVEVNGISSVENGNLFVNLSDGGTALVDDISFDDPRVDQLYAAATKFDTQTAKAFVSGYDGSSDVGTYYSGFASIYGAARNGQSFEQAVSNSLHTLSTEAQQLAYYAGQNAGILVDAMAPASALPISAQPAQTNPAMSSDTTQEGKLTPASDKRTGVVRNFTRKLSKSQEQSIKVIDAIARAIGRTVNIVENIEGHDRKVSANVKDAHGSYIEGTGNAYFDPSTNEYYISLNGIGEAYIYFALHENIHDIAANNPLGYENLKQIIFDVLREQGADVDTLVSDQMEQFGYDDATAREEVVANTVPSILTDKQTADMFIERIIGADADTRNAFEKIIDSIRDFMQKMYDILKGEKSWAQMELIKGNIEAIARIREAYFDALSGIAQINDQTSEIKYAIKDVNGKKYVEADRDVIKGDNPKEWAKQIEKYINEQIRKGKDVIVYTANGVPLTITADTAGKATFRNYVELSDGSKRLMTDAEYAVKLRAEAHIDELGQVSKGVGKIVPDSKGHLFAKEGFNYRTAYFKDKTGYYELTISIGKNGKINTIYNVGKIKEAAFPTNGLNGPTRSKTETGNRASLIDRVPQKDTTVKDSIRENREKDAEEPEKTTRFSMKDFVIKELLP